MDPDKCLEDLRKRVHKMLEESDPISESDAVDLAGEVYALDQWLSRGGFLPAAWERNKGQSR